MSNAPDALLSHLRADIELKAEIIKALRVEQERMSEAAEHEAALMAGISAELMSLATNAALLLSETESGTLQRSAEQFKEVCADLADYTAARTGQLALADRPVSIRQLLSRLAARHPLELRIAPDVPERIVADEQQLAKLLAHFVSQDCAGLAPALEVCRSEPGSAQLVFSLRRTDGDPPVQRGDDLPVVGRLRRQLAHALCRFIGGTLSAERLVLPIRTAVDQGHTGVFRLGLSEAAAAGSDLTDITAAAPGAAQLDDEEESIDLVYLDRQLGSLADVILTRTAPAFIADAERRMTDLHVAFESGDAGRLHDAAQACKGSALTVGACKLASLLDTISKQTAQGRLPAAGVLWQVRRAFERAVQVLGSRVGAAEQRA
jgi:hypothetical protein